MADTTHNIKLVATLDSSQIKPPYEQQSSSGSSGTGSQIAANFKNLESAIQRLNSSMARLSSSIQRLIGIQQQTINISRTNIARSQVGGTTPIPGGMSEKQIAGTSKAALGMIVTQALGPVSDLLKTKGHEEAASAINGASSIASGAMMGAAIGSFIPGIGTAIGASVGTLTSGIGLLAEQLNESAQKEMEARERIAKMLDDQYKALADLNNSLFLIDIKDIIKSGSDQQLGSELQGAQSSESVVEGQFRSGFEAFKSTMDQIGDINRDIFEHQTQAENARSKGWTRSVKYHEEQIAKLEKQKEELTEQAELQKKSAQQSLKDLSFRQQIASMLEQEAERRKRAAEHAKKQEELEKKQQELKEKQAKAEQERIDKTRQANWDYLNQIALEDEHLKLSKEPLKAAEYGTFDEITHQLEAMQAYVDQQKQQRDSFYEQMKKANIAGDFEKYENLKRAYEQYSGNLNFGIQMREQLASGLQDVFKEMMTYKGLQIGDFGQLAALGGFGSTSVLGDPMLDLQREQNRILGEMLRAIRDQDNTARYL